MTRDELRKEFDSVNVSYWANAHGGPLPPPLADKLEPRLWEALRVELQRRYRLATGEATAVLTVATEPG